MNINLEIEFKCLLPKETFLKIRKDYFENESCFSQTNEYFIDKKGLLRAHLYSLRIRHVNGQIEFTLKKPQGFSKIEMNEYLSEETYHQLLNHQPIESQILQELLQIGVALKDLTILTSLTTHRYEIKYLGGNLCLDENEYNGIKDYEIEYEALDEKDGRTIFTQLLADYQISYQSNCPGKMTRAINKKINA